MRKSAEAIRKNYFFFFAAFFLAIKITRLMTRNFYTILFVTICLKTSRFFRPKPKQNESTLLGSWQIIFMKKMIALMPALMVLSVIITSGCTTDKHIGGDRDEHGCLGPAGYMWDGEVGACIRTWELDEDQKRAAGIAVDYVGEEYATTVVEVVTARCRGCFIVKLEQGEERDSVTVDVNNWTAAGKTVTRHTCTEEEKAAEICTMQYDPVCGWSELGVSRTYGNPCQACAAGVEYWEPGECEAEGMSPQECLEMGGRTVNTVGGATCEENETKAGDVQGFISPNICCVPS
jgi:hypothetical protein